MSRPEPRAQDEPARAASGGFDSAKGRRWLGQLVAPAGCAVVLLALLADPLGIGGQPGWGYKQTALLLPGIVLCAGAAIGRRTAAGAFAAFFALSVLIFGMDVRDDPSGLAIAAPWVGDTPMFMWFLEWWPHAIANGLNPVVTDRVMAWEPYNLMRTTSLPGPSILMAPITAVADPVVTYNLLMLAAPATAALGAFLLCRHLTERFWPSMLGGFIFGFSPYMAAHMLAHANLALVGLVPIVALLVVRRVDGSLGPRRFVGLLTVVLALQFATAAEIFVSQAVFLAIGLGIAFATIPSSRRRLPRAAAESAASGVLALVLAAPLTYYALKGSGIEPSQSPEVYSADLVALLVPSPSQSFGGATFGEVAARWTGNQAENGVYLGLPLLVLLTAGARWARPLVILLWIAVVLAFGPKLHVGGIVTSMSLPWELVVDLPFLEYALPVRFLLYGFLAAAVAAALIVVRAGGRWWPWALAVVAAISILPAVESGQWKRETVVPQFFRDSDALAGERVLILPDSSAGDSMLYQADADFSFQMVGGYLGVAPEWYSAQEFPILDSFAGGAVLPDSESQLRRFARERRVTVFLLDLRRDSPSLRTMLEPLGAPVETGGVAIYRVPAGWLEPAS